MEPELTLTEIFHPEDLCARCDEEEPDKGFVVTIESMGQTAKLFFCSAECKGRFVRGAEAVGELPDAF